MTSNKTLQDCIFRPPDARLTCPDPDVKYILYNDGKKEVVNYAERDWLHQSIWDRHKEDVFIVHGYAGGDDTLPIAVLRDGKLS